MHFRWTSPTAAVTHFHQSTFSFSLLKWFNSICTSAESHFVSDSLHILFGPLFIPPSTPANFHGTFFSNVTHIWVYIHLSTSIWIVKKCNSIFFVQAEIPTHKTWSVCSPAHISFTTILVCFVYEHSNKIRGVFHRNKRNNDYFNSVHFRHHQHALDH